jgi:hypothetical protein
MALKTRAKSAMRAIAGRASRGSLSPGLRRLGGIGLSKTSRRDYSPRIRMSILR